MSKVSDDAAGQLTAVLRDGMTIAVRGFGLCGIPTDLITIVRDSGVTAIVADTGLVHAHTADVSGNLRYRLTARNFNPVAAMSGRTTFAQAEHIVELDHDDIHTPGVFIHHLSQATSEKDIEQRTTRPRPETQEVA